MNGEECVTSYGCVSIVPLRAMEVSVKAQWNWWGNDWIEFWFYHQIPTGFKMSSDAKEIL